MGSLRNWIGFALASGLVAVTPGCGSDGGGGNGRDGSTSDPVCGNGIVEEGEDCDEGASNNVDGSGCDSDCTFSCTADEECDDRNLCNGTETCNLTLHRCQMGTPPEVGTECTYEDDVVSLCIGQVCAKPCTDSDEECNDGNPCNGEETCNLELQGCQPGEELECDDGLECTTNECFPETGCVFTLIDGDEDGYAPEHLDCDERGGDCDDSKPAVNPGVPEICGDGIDNNCSGAIDDPSPWYVDCDGDGYAASTGGAITACSKPADASGCTWTATNPNGISTTDCDDTNAAVYPPAAAHTTFYTRPYCRGSGQLALGSAPNFHCDGLGGPGALSWDFDCNGTAQKENPNYITSCVEINWTPPPVCCAIPLSGDDAPEATAAHKSQVGGGPEPAGLAITPCYACANSCSSSRTGYWNASPACGYTGEWRTCTGQTGCSCYNCSTCYCGSSTSNPRQKCK
jgi:hypothetical protein